MTNTTFTTDVAVVDPAFSDAGRYALAAVVLARSRQKAVDAG
ncbi:MAG: hypothetical protein ACLGIC_13870 [Acidimicrobiia bacterium]